MVRAAELHALAHLPFWARHRWELPWDRWWATNHREKLLVVVFLPSDMHGLRDAGMDPRPDRPALK